MQNVLVLFGGASPEHDVSVVSAACVLDAFPRDRFNPVTVGITKEGNWLLCESDSAVIRSGEWKEEETHIMPSLNSLQRGIFAEGIGFIPVDAAFPVLHGEGGEDGCVQGLLKLAGIPCVGCSPAASAVCMDKYYTNCVLDAAGIPQAAWVSFTKSEWLSDRATLTEYMIEELLLPIFVKPSATGSSIGISKAATSDELTAAVDNAFLYGERVVCEEFIDGAEIEVAVLGTPAEASVCGRIIPAGEFYDYESKYVSDSKLIIPADIPDATSERIRFLATEAFDALSCSGMARVDFLLRTADGDIFLNEVNTIPGFTPISMYPKLWQECGVSYGELITRLITDAMTNSRES